MNRGDIQDWLAKRAWLPGDGGWYSRSGRYRVVFKQLVVNLEVLVDADHGWVRAFGSFYKQVRVDPATGLLMGLGFYSWGHRTPVAPFIQDIQEIVK